MNNAFSLDGHPEHSCHVTDDGAVTNARREMITRGVIFTPPNVKKKNHYALALDKHNL